jgi:hypothetical protein
MGTKSRKWIPSLILINVAELIIRHSSVVFFLVHFDAVPIHPDVGIKTNCPNESIRNAFHFPKMTRANRRHEFRLS